MVVGSRCARTLRKDLNVSKKLGSIQKGYPSSRINNGFILIAK